MYSCTTGGDGGVRYDGGNWKTVYMAFAFEAACPYETPFPAAERRLVLGRILEWFGRYMDVPETPAN